MVVADGLCVCKVNRGHFSSNEQLHVQIFDYDLLSDDDDIGSVMLEVYGA